MATEQEIQAAITKANLGGERAENAASAANTEAAKATQSANRANSIADQCAEQVNRAKAIEDSFNNAIVNKVGVLPTYPAVQPTENTTAINARDQFAKDKDKDDKIKANQDKIVQLEQETKYLQFLSEENAFINKLDLTRIIIGRRVDTTGNFITLENAVTSNIITLPEGASSVYIDGLPNNIIITFYAKPYLLKEDIIGKPQNAVTIGSSLVIPSGAKYIVVTLFSGGQGSIIPDLSNCIIKLNNTIKNMLSDLAISPTIARTQYLEDEIASIKGGDGYNIASSTSWNRGSITTTGSESPSDGSSYRYTFVNLSAGKYKIKSRTGGTATPMLVRYNTDGSFDKIIIAGSANEKITVIDLIDAKYGFQHQSATIPTDQVVLCKVFEPLILPSCGVDIIKDLPISTGGDITVGYAYIDSVTGVVKVKL